jgi:GntR family transcriptional regulator of arabinose operon
MLAVPPGSVNQESGRKQGIGSAMQPSQERGGRIPIHRLIAESIAAAIERGEHPHGSRLPSEASLVGQFGISRGTVRHALNSLRARGLIEAVPTRGWFVRAAAPEPANGRRRVVGVVIPSVARPSLPELLSAIEGELHDHGYSMLVGSSGWSREQQAGRIRRILTDGVSGLICYPIDYEPDGELFTALASGGFPVLLIDRHIVGCDLDAVEVDNVGGAYAAVTHLIEQGHRRIAFISTDNLSTTSVAERLEGYRHALASGGIEADPTLLFARIPIVRTWGTDYPAASKDQARVIAAFLASSDATAAFGLHDLLALEVVAAARSLRRRVPEDFAVAGFDDDPLLGNVAVPLTTVAQPREHMGRIAARLIVERIEGRRVETSRVVLPTRLVVRRSTVAQLPLAAASA